MFPSQKYDFQALFRSQGGLHLSCYLENKGALKDTEEQLSLSLAKAELELSAVCSEDQVRGFLKPLRMLQQEQSMLSQVNGHVAIFRKDRFFRVMSVPVDVSFASIVATSFHIKPLLRWQQIDQNFFLLGLSGHQVFLYHGNQFQLKRMPFEDVGRLRSFEQWIASLPFAERPPVFLVGSARQTLQCRRQFPYLFAKRLRSFKHFDPSALGEMCFHIRRTLKQDQKQRIQEAFEEYDDAKELGLASDQLPVIMRAAVQGQVRRLIIADAPKIFGKLDWSTGDYQVNPFDMDHEDDDLLDDLAQIVLAKGSNVVVASASEINAKTPALAILYPRSQSFLRPLPLKPARLALAQKPWLQLSEA